MIHHTLKRFLFLVTTALSATVIEDIDQIDDLFEASQKKYSIPQQEEMAAALLRQEEKVRIVSYNILFNKFDHQLDHVYRWPERKHRLIEMIQILDADVMGVQELYPSQKDFLLESIGDEYEFYSKPCKDGEHNGIFYRRERYLLEDARVWYLAKCECPQARSLTMIRLFDLKTCKSFAVFNAHLAFFDVNKRAFEGKMIGEIIADFIDTHQIPVVMTGDLNTFPNFPHLKKLPFRDGGYVERLIKRDKLRDARDVTLFGHFGPLSTFSNKAEESAPFQGYGTPGVFLDHILVSKRVTVLTHAVDPSTIEGLFPSDHLPLIADILID